MGKYKMFQTTNQKLVKGYRTVLWTVLVPTLDAKKTAAEAALCQIGEEQQHI